MELFAFLSLHKGVCAVLVAVLNNVLLKLSLTLGLKLKDDTVFNIEFSSLEGVEGLSEVLDVNCPG